jgi:hypothetical protein
MGNYLCAGSLGQIIITGRMIGMIVGVDDEGNLQLVFAGKVEYYLWFPCRVNYSSSARLLVPDQIRKVLHRTNWDLMKDHRRPPVWKHERKLRSRNAFRERF